MRILSFKQVQHPLDIISNILISISNSIKISIFEFDRVLVYWYLKRYDTLTVNFKQFWFNSQGREKLLFVSQSIYYVF